MDREQELKSKALEERDLRIAYWRTFGETEHGQKVLADLMKRCGHNDLSYVRGEPDHTSFNEGRRWVDLYINNMLDPERLEDSKRQVEAKEGEE